MVPIFPKHCIILNVVGPTMAIFWRVISLSFSFKHIFPRFFFIHLFHTPAELTTFTYLCGLQCPLSCFSFLSSYHSQLGQVCDKVHACPSYLLAGYCFRVPTLHPSIIIIIRAKCVLTSLISIKIWFFVTFIIAEFHPSLATIGFTNKMKFINYKNTNTRFILSKIPTKTILIKIFKT